MKSSVFIIILMTIFQASGLNQQVENLGDNSWLKMNPPREPDARNYTGTCWSEYGVWYWGGGHFSYACDDIDFYDMETNTWTRSYTPTCYQWEYDQGAPTPQGTVYPRHTYQQVAWDPVQQLFFYFNKGRTWTYDPVAKDWTVVAGEDGPSGSVSPVTSTGIQHHGCIYSPDLQAPLALLSSNPRRVYRWDSNTQTWNQRSGGFAPVSNWTETYSAYMSSHNLHFMSFPGDQSFYTYDAVAESWSKVSDAPGEIVGSKSLAYDPDNDIVLLVNGRDSKVFYAYHPQTDNWEKINASGAPTGDGTSACQDFTGLWYDRDHKAFFFLNRDDNYHGKTWVYRYKKSGNTISAGSNRGYGRTMNVEIHPNPFIADVRIKLRIADCGLRNLGNLCIYNINGVLVQDFKSEIRNPKSEIEWNAGNQPSGIYLLKFRSGTRQITKRLFLTR
jgi:hypothetical protein